MKRFSKSSTLLAVCVGPLCNQPLSAATPLRAPHGAVAAIGLSDLTPYETIAYDALAFVTKGDIAGAQKLGTDLETAWDRAEDTMKPTDPAK